jgi:hypothetical protein
MAMSSKPTSGPNNFRFARDPGTMSRFAPRIVSQLAQNLLGLRRPVRILWPSTEISQCTEARYAARQSTSRHAARAW